MEIELLWIFGIILGILAFAAGWRIASNVRNKKATQDLTAIPYLGPMIDFKKWLPIDKTGWNIIINKILILVLTSLCFLIGGGYGMTLGLVTILAVLYDIDWMEK
jgi:hypothetical protein